jgi:hypothetical protein
MGFVLVIAFMYDNTHVVVYNTARWTPPEKREETALRMSAVSVSGPLFSLQLAVQFY